ncbi:MAG: nitroreductase family protein [Planctomycetota bacterium]
MDFDTIIRTRRSIRRFRQDPIDKAVLLTLIEAARCAPSAANRQPIRYVVVDNLPLCSRVFEQLAWAAYVQPKRNPPPSREPVAYIVVLVDHAVTPAQFASADVGAAVENVLLLAWAKGIGSCWLGSINRDNLKDLLRIPDHLHIDSVIALGVPDETPVMEDALPDSVKYYLDDNNTLHVPKHRLIDITHYNKFGTKI